MSRCRGGCNAQVLIRRTLHIVAVAGGGPGNRNDPIHYRGTDIERLCQAHGHVLADGGYRGIPELVTPCSNDVASSEICAGANIDGAEHVSSTPSPGSRTGASFAITAGAARA